MSADMGDYEQPNKQTEFIVCKLQISNTRFEGSIFNHLKITCMVTNLMN